MATNENNLISCHKINQAPIRAFVNCENSGFVRGGKDRYYGVKVGKFE